MRQLARHHGLVVRILQLMCLCVVLSLIVFNTSIAVAGSLKASWNANTEPDLAGYKIYYGEASGNYTNSINVGKNTQYAINQLKDGVTYYFVIAAYDTAGNESAYSLEVSAKTIVVDNTPPTVVSVTPRELSTLEVKFSEAVGQNSALNQTNYAIDNGITVTAAAFQANSTTTVLLTTSAHATGKTYKLTIQKIADRAATPNVMPQAVSFNYLIPVVDRTPPTVASFRAVDAKTLEVFFNEAVSAASAQTVANYTINNNVAVQSAQLQADTRTVKLTTGSHANGVAYTLTVRNVADRAAPPNVMAQPATFNYNFQSTDKTAPELSNARLVNATTLEVLFSEPVTVASTQTLANYSINLGVTISRAQLQTDNRTVLLTTTAHGSGNSYVVTVRNISDRAAPSNVMPAPRTFNYTYQVEDRQPPEVNAVTMTDLTHLLIVFNEQVTIASAQNVNNYRLSDNIQVQQARLANNGLEVTLTTSTHLYNKDYTVTVVNVKDRAATANTIAANATFTYFLANNSNGSGAQVNSLNPARYVADSLQIGEAYYIDRPYVIRQVPNNKRNVLWIKTANVDRTNSAERFLEFTLTRESNIYVAFDSRAAQPPNWLQNAFTNTGEVIAVSESGGTLNLWKARHVPGRVSLGGNVAAGVQTSTSLSMYVVMIEDVLTPPNPGTATPQSFVLQQNYPNPFSRSGAATGLAQTKIDYYLQEPQTVTLTVHNTIGQVVRQLYSGLQPAGNHTATWDGRGDNGKLLPSGTYLCVLEVRAEVNNAGFAMTAALNRQMRVMTLLK